ncbi:hypothetical protein PENSPDRAFT_667890 [Peniophora sp. CONT]|nr:hypothetical protein PENSPDRAFT_667890 [Peniophora sp. CONT]
MVQTRSHTEGAVFAVHVGRQRGIFTTWAETLKHVKDYQGTIYKKLSSRAEAERWLNDYAARDAERSSPVNLPGAPGQRTGHQPIANALGLVIEPSASRERVTSAPAQDASMHADDSDDNAYAEVRAAEEVLRRARAKVAAKSKAKAGAAAVSEWEAAMPPEASASIKREKDARVKKEQEIVVDVQTWSQVKVEKETRKDEQRYTASEKGKGRATTSRRPVEATTAPSTQAPATMQRSMNEASVATVQANQKPTPVPATEAAASRKASVPPKQTQVTSPRPALDGKSAIPATRAPAAANVASSTPSAINSQTGTAAPDPYILAYTDGSAKNNQSPLRIGGYGVHWGAGRPAGAIIRVLELTISDPRPLTIVSDSKYSIDCFDWLKGWRNRGWKKSTGEVPENLDLVRYMVALRTLRAGSTIIQHEKAHKGDKKGAILTPHQRGNKIADSLANAGSDLPEEVAEKVSDEDWAKARASAEKRVEELNRKEESETVHIDVGSAMGLTQHSAPDVGGTSQAMSQMAITVKKAEIATTAGGSGTPRGGKLSRDAIKAVLSSSQVPDTSAPSSSTPAAASAEPHGQTPTPASSQSISNSTPARAPVASTSAPAAASTQTSTAPAPQTPSRPNARTGGHTSSQAARAHTTPVATGPGKEPDGKVIVRLVDEEKEPYDEGIWDEEDTLDDADMIAEAMGS